ncbi:hypothetical protein ABKN59_005573 [Abortiporus biennis]
MHIPLISDLAKKLYRRRMTGLGITRTPPRPEAVGNAIRPNNRSPPRRPVRPAAPAPSPPPRPVAATPPKSANTGSIRNEIAKKTIPAGQPFAGRLIGGGTRVQIYGNRTYGSGYPYGCPAGGIRGVNGLPFPFSYWPVVRGAGFGYSGSYLFNTEYGKEDNSTRLGGRMMEAAFISSQQNNTFHVLSDNSTVLSLISSVNQHCTGSHLNPTSSSKSPIVFNTSNPLEPRPEQAIQYYRASSIVLTLDGYNNTATLSNTNGEVDVPIPSWVDTSLMNCINSTIGQYAPLVGETNSASSNKISGTDFGFIGLIWIISFWVMRLI